MDAHVNSTILHKLHVIRDKGHAFFSKKNMAMPAFWEYPVTKPTAKKLADMARVRKPRPGYQVDIAHDYDEKSTSPWRWSQPCVWQSPAAVKNKSSSVTRVSLSPPTSATCRATPSRSRATPSPGA